MKRIGYHFSLGTKSPRTGLWLCSGKFLKLASKGMASKPLSVDAEE